MASNTPSVLITPHFYFRVPSAWKPHSYIALCWTSPGCQMNNPNSCSRTEFLISPPKPDPFITFYAWKVTTASFCCSCHSLRGLPWLNLFSPICWLSSKPLLCTFAEQMQSLTILHHLPESRPDPSHTHFSLDIHHCQGIHFPLFTQTHAPLQIISHREAELSYQP